MEKFAIVSRVDNISSSVKQQISDSLVMHHKVLDEDNPDIVICVGGDGTLLYAVHEYIDKLDSISFVAIHTGTLGFYTDYTQEQVKEFIRDILKDEPVDTFESSMIEIDLNDNKLYALNEMRIENVARTQAFEIYIDNEFFEKFKGNGMCLSTQAGSTAYNRSLKGAVVDSGVSLLQLVEIAGIHDSKHRSLGVPYILRDDREVEFRGDFEHAQLCYDYLNIKLDNVRKIKCRLSDKKVKFIRYHNYSYLERVRNLY